MSRLNLMEVQRHQFHFLWGIGALIVLSGIGLWVLTTAAKIRTHTLPVGGVELSMPYSKYLIGEPITFTLRNNYNSPVYVENACPNEPLNVYLLKNTTWIRLHDTATLQACPSEDRQISVPPNGIINGNFLAWPHLFTKPGHYRVVAYVEYYSALPYQEFDIITTPAPYQPPLAAVTQATTQGGIASTVTPSLTRGTTTTTTTTTGTTTTRPPTSATPVPTPAPTTAPAYVAQHYSIGVNSSGNYDTTNLHLHPTDTLTINYLRPFSSEVRTSFHANSGTTSTIGSVTVDSEFTSRTITLQAKGSWRYLADDHSGNSGTLIVN
jgi:hypothetical protein